VPVFNVAYHLLEHADVLALVNALGYVNDVPEFEFKPTPVFVAVLNHTHDFVQLHVLVDAVAQFEQPQHFVLHVHLVDGDPTHLELTELNGVAVVQVDVGEYLGHFLQAFIRVLEPLEEHHQVFLADLAVRVRVYFLEYFAYLEVLDFVEVQITHLKLNEFAQLIAELCVLQLLQTDFGFHFFVYHQPAQLLLT